MIRLTELPKIPKPKCKIGCACIDCFAEGRAVLLQGQPGGGFKAVMPTDCCWSCKDGNPKGANFGGGGC